MKKKAVEILLLMLILGSYSCHKLPTINKTPQQDAGSSSDTNQVVENPPSTPPMSLETLQSILKVDYYEDMVIHQKTVF